VTRRELLAVEHVHSIGLHGASTYRSIEGNILKARALAERLRRRSRVGPGAPKEMRPSFSTSYPSPSSFVRIHINSQK
jgi:hypothetical protein